MGGPLAHLLGLRPIFWAFGPITIQSMDDLGRLQGRYPENFMLISQLEVCQEGGCVGWSRREGVRGSDKEKYYIIGPKAQEIGRRPTQQTSAGARMRGV